MPRILVLSALLFLYLYIYYSPWNVRWKYNNNVLDNDLKIKSYFLFRCIQNPMFSWHQSCILILDDVSFYKTIKGHTYENFSGRCFKNSTEDRINNLITVWLPFNPYKEFVKFLMKTRTPLWCRLGWKIVNSTNLDLLK